MKAVGILGGTFDPIHLGHLITAQKVIVLRNLEKIIFVPCNISPHKTEEKFSSAGHRLNMLRLAINDIPYFDYSDTELKRSGISYMVDTLNELNKVYPLLELIIGYDNIKKFNTWKNPDEILSVATLIVMKRKVEKEIETKDMFYNSAVFIETPFVDIKATDIRERVKNNLPIDFLVTPEVKNYIYKNNLYKS